MDEQQKDAVDVELKDLPLPIVFDGGIPVKSLSCWMTDDGRPSTAFKGPDGQVLGTLVGVAGASPIMQAVVMDKMLERNEVSWGWNSANEQAWASPQSGGSRLPVKHGIADWYDDGVMIGVEMERTRPDHPPRRHCLTCDGNPFLAEATLRMMITQWADAARPFERDLPSTTKTQQQDMGR